MTWTAVAGKSPVQNPGDVVTTVTLTNVGTGKPFNRDYRNDGTAAGLIAAIRATLSKMDASTDTIAVVAPGTVLDIADPAVVVPDPPTKAQQARDAFFTDLRASQQQAKSDALPADLKARCLPEYVSGL